MHKIVGVRMSDELRAFLDARGQMSAHARALILLGAHAAGYDLSPLRNDLAALANEVLDMRLQEAYWMMFNSVLNGVYNDPLNIPAGEGGHLPNPQHLGLSPEDDPPALASDPFAALGIDV